MASSSSPSFLQLDLNRRLYLCLCLLCLLVVLPPAVSSKEPCNCSDEDLAIEQQLPRTAPTSAAEPNLPHGSLLRLKDQSWAAAHHLERPFPEPLRNVTGMGTLKLRAVQVVFRHGERSPLDLSFKDHPFVHPNGNEACSDRLEPSATPTSRHPQFTLKMDSEPFVEPRVWSHHHPGSSSKCYAGQLSNTGKNSMFLLGKKLKERYIHVEGLLEPESVPSPAELNVHSTNVSRTLESAMYLMQGMFPAITNSQADTRVEIRLRNKSKEFLQPAFHTCPRFRDLWGHKSAEAARRNRQQSQAIINLLEDLIHPFEGLTAQNFYDLLACHEAHRIPMPAQVTEEVFKEVARIFAETWWRFVDDDEELRRLGAGRLLDELLRVFSLPLEARPKISLYSAHDTTLAFLLSSLQVANRHWPPCSSQLIFELYDREVSEGQHHTSEQFLRLIYNNEVLVVPGCTEPDAARPDLCPLGQLRELSANLIPQDFAQECAL